MPASTLSQGVLDGVGILKLIHQNMPEALLVVLQQLRLLQPQLVGAQQQFRKVHQPAPFTGRFIGGIDALHGLQIEVAEAGRRQVGSAQALVLAAIDKALHLTRRPAAFIQLQPAANALDQPLLVVGIENLEIAGQTGVLPMGLQQTVRQTVKGPHPQALGADFQHLFNAGAHFPSRLVGEGNSQDRPGRQTLRLYQPGDAVHQHPGLAAAGAGQHQQVAAFAGYRVALGLIQGVENAGYIHGRILSNAAG